MKKYKFRLLAAVVATAFAGSALAAVSPEEAKQLGGATLTPWGAERAGNKDGTIPEWTSERPAPPADYDPKEPTRLPNPWKDKPLFTITAKNMDKYADKLTVGVKQMLKQYPDFRVNVYQTHRTVNYPKYVLDNMTKNATSCKGANNELELVGCYGGTAFPIPKTGNQVMWNHTTRYSLHGYHLLNEAWLTNGDGKQVSQGHIDSHQTFPLFDPARTKPAGPKDYVWMLRWDMLSPARKVGEKYVLLDAFDTLNVGRRVYTYIPGQRRVKLAPDLAYDTPSPVAGGAATMDQSQVFNGAQDRYDFKLVGKQEKYMMYNTYDLHDYRVCPIEKILRKNFANPDCVRWELHRVWVVEATLKPGFRHILPKRTFYFDEDGFGAGASDDYDASGKLAKTVLLPFIHLYNTKTPGNFSDNEMDHDLITGAWFSSCLFGKPLYGLDEDIIPKEPMYFSPEAIAGEGVR